VALQLDSKTRLNFEHAAILLVEQSPHGLEVLQQILTGFGARRCVRASTIEAAQQEIKHTVFDLVLIDPAFSDADGYDFIRWLRRSETPANRTAPIIVLSSNGAKSAILRARNAGANFFLKKPITPASLLERIVWITKDPRQFVEAAQYAGPDRRFRFEGPPPGEAPRRADDITTKLDDAGQPNLSQSDIDALLKPQKVQL
jgi:CheY-like chemotaxis protein